MKRSFFFFFFLIFCLAAKAQTDTLVYYLNEHSEYLPGKEGMETMRMVIKPVKPEKYYTVRDYYKDGKIKLVTHSKKDDGSEFEGDCLEYYPNGKRKSIRNYHEYKITGFYYGYHRNGSLYTIMKYNEMGRLVIDEMHDSTGVVIVANGNGKGMEYFGPPLNHVDKGDVIDGKREGEWRRTVNDTLKAVFFYANDDIESGIGYDKAGHGYPFKRIQEGAIPEQGFFELSRKISDKVTIPKEAKKLNLRGTVVLNATVSVDGKLSDIKVSKGFGYGVDEQVLKLFKEDRSVWTPAKSYGMPLENTISFSVVVGYSRY